MAALFVCLYTGAETFLSLAALCSVRCGLGFERSSLGLWLVTLVKSPIAQIPRGLPPLPTNWPAKPTLSWVSVKVLGLPPGHAPARLGANLSQPSGCYRPALWPVGKSQALLTYSWVIAPGRQIEPLDLSVCRTRQRGHCQKSTASGGARMPGPAPELQPAAALTAPLPRRLSGCRASSGPVLCWSFPSLSVNFLLSQLRCHCGGSPPLITQAAWLCLRS